MNEDKLDISSKIANWATTNVKYIAFGAIITGNAFGNKT